MLTRQLVVVCLGALLAPAAQAQTTDHQIPYQGRLDLDGVAMNGPFDFWFELYPTPTGGDCQVTAPPHAECLWADELAGVDVAAGNFSVVLGSTTNPLGDAIWQNPEVYLGIRVAASGDAFTPLAGRQRILAVPMAARAETAKNYHVTGTLRVVGGATFDADATVAGHLGVGTAPQASRALVVNGADNDGANAALAITSGGQTLLVDGNEIDAVNDSLHLQNNSSGGVEIHGPLTFSDAATTSQLGTFGGNWGSWYPSSTTWYQCPANYYVCGYRFRYEGDQGSGDDTAFNAIQMLCCSLGS